MKKTFFTLAFAFAAAILLSSFPAQATGVPQPPPPVVTPTPNKADSAATSSQGQGQQMGQGQQARGTGTGTGTGTANAQNSMSVSDGTYNSDYNAKSLAIALPTLAFTPPMPIQGCPSGDITQDSFGVGMGIVSKASSKSSGKPCYAILMYNDYLQQCQWESARRFKTEMALELYPNFKPAGYKDGSDSWMFDFTPAECATWRTPVKPQPVDYDLIRSFIKAEMPPPPTCPAPAPSKPGKKKAAPKKAFNCTPISK